LLVSLFRVDVGNQEPHPDAGDGRRDCIQSGLLGGRVVVLADIWSVFECLFKLVGELAVVEVAVDVRFSERVQLRVRLVLIRHSDASLAGGC